MVTCSAGVLRDWCCSHIKSSMHTNTLSREAATASSKFHEGKIARGSESPQAERQGRWSQLSRRMHHIAQRAAGPFAATVLMSEGASEWLHIVVWVTLCTFLAKQSTVSDSFKETIISFNVVEALFGELMFERFSWDALQGGVRCSLTSAFNTVRIFLGSDYCVTHIAQRKSLLVLSPEYFSMY